jgi:hypothetical protein
VEIFSCPASLGSIGLRLTSHEREICPGVSWMRTRIPCRCISSSGLDTFGMLESTVFSDVSMFEKKIFAIEKVSSRVPGCNSCNPKRDPPFLSPRTKIGGAKSNWTSRHLWHYRLNFTSCHEICDRDHKVPESANQHELRACATHDGMIIDGELFRLLNSQTSLSFLLQGLG